MSKLYHFASNTWIKSQDSFFHIVGLTDRQTFGDNGFRGSFNKEKCEKALILSILQNFDEILCSNIERYQIKNI